MNTQADKKRWTGIEYGLILLVFCICLAGALLLPVEQCPDEAGRRLLSDWILHMDTLPKGDEPEIMIPGWGFSYALRPYLSSLIGAFFERAAVCFTDSPRILLAASRMGSVLSVTFCSFFCLKLGHRLFENRSSTLLFASVVCFLPQVMFLGMYQNNDALSLCAVSMMLNYLVEGGYRKWPVKSCMGLAVAFSIGLLSYYSIYGWLLMGAAFCVLAVLTDRGIPDKGQMIGKRAALIAGICLLLAGWFFIRNAYLHGGDLLGIAAENVSRDRMQEQGTVLYSYVCYREAGLSAAQFFRLKNYEWLRMTVESFIGVFGYMLIYLPKLQYVVYCAIFGCAILLFFAALPRQETCRRDRLFMGMLLLNLLKAEVFFPASYPEKNIASCLRNWSDGILTGSTKARSSARFGVF